MNRHLHRVVFNAARGVRMVVQETATSTGKGASRATAVGAMTVAGLLLAAAAQAQIVGAPNVPGNLRPTVLVAPNGVPLVNISHAVVVDKIAGGRAFIRDPSPVGRGSSYTISVADLQKSMSGRAVYLFSEK